MDSAGFSAIVAGASAILAAILSTVATLSVGRLRRGLQVQVLLPRLEAYRKLWDLTRAGSDGHDLDQEARYNLEAAVYTWYYTSGNGIFLSNRSRGLIVEVQTLLRHTTADWDDIANKISELRQSLRNDIGVYGTDRPWHRRVPALPPAPRQAG